MKNLYLPLLVSMVLGLITQNIASAESIPGMKFETIDGGTLLIGSKNLEITFADGNLLASDGNANLQISLANLKSFYFIDSITSVELTEDLSSDINVLSISGTRIGKFKSLEEARQLLPTGIYVIEKGNSNYKIVIK